MPEPNYGSEEGTAFVPAGSETVLTLHFTPEGALEFLWSDDLAELVQEGEVAVRRASYVEYEDIGWFVDLSPVGGSRYGPFLLRKNALEFEADWLTKHFLGTGGRLK